MRGLYKFLPLFAIFMLFTPSLALAVPCDANCQYVWKGIFGFDPQWLNEPRELIINVLIPSAAIYMIFLGVFRAIGMNRMMGGLEYGIAAVVMLSTLFTGFLGAINTWALAVLGQFAFWGFLAAFVAAGAAYFIGIGRRARGELRISKEYLDEVGHLQNDLKTLKDALDKAREDAINIKKSAAERQKAEKLAAKIETKIRQRDEDLQKLNETYRRMP